MNSPRHFLSASTNPMPHRRLCTLALTLAVGLLFIVGARAQGQAPVPDALITVGTTTTDGQNRRWGYVLWNPATEAITAGKRYGVYLKPGGPDDATAFVRQSVIQEERDATVLSALVDRSGFLGANLAELDATLLSMVTREGITAPPVGPAAKLALLMNRPAGEMNIRSQLRILSLGQPSVGFSLGSAWAGIIPSGQVTLEIRELDPVQLTDVAIVGRITLAAGVPAPLPPPGAPKQVWTPPSAVEISSRDHLNIKLRWGNPPELARVSLLSRGYHVWRVSVAEALKRGINPDVASTAQLVDWSTRDLTLAKRVTDSPVLTLGGVTPAQALNPDFQPGRFDVVDDNGHAFEGGPEFTECSQWRYYITAVDLLGRDGAASPSGQGVACRTVGTVAPDAVQVRNEWIPENGNPLGRQALLISWRQLDNAAIPLGTTLNYWIYRGTNISDLEGTNAFLLKPFASILHRSDRQRLERVDDVFTPNADWFGRTLWYAVRAVATSPGCTLCPAAPSGFSGPAFGSLRQRQGPDAAIGSVQVRCGEPGVEPLGSSLSRGDSDLQQVHFKYVLKRRDSTIAWARIGLSPRGRPEEIQWTETTAFNNRPFASDLVLEQRFPRPATPETYVVACIFGSVDGRVSRPYQAEIDSPIDPRDEVVVNLLGLMSYTYVTPVALRDRDFSDCQHHARAPEGSPDESTVHPLRIGFKMPSRAREYRVYRRVDEGELTLISQGTSEPNTDVTRLDDAPPIAGGRACYFVQVFDTDGNASPMGQLDCVSIVPQRLPQPRLFIPEAITNALGEAQMRLRWFCPPSGVDRFVIQVASAGSTGPTSATNSSSPSTKVLAALKTLPTAQWMTDAATGARALESIVPLYGPRVGGRELGSGPDFTLDLPTQPGNRLKVTVTAVSITGVLGDPSDARVFEWALSPPRPPDRRVPWPARPVPTAIRIPGIEALVIATNRLIVPTNTLSAILGVRVARSPYFVVQDNNPGWRTDFLGSEGSRGMMERRNPNRHSLFPKDVAGNAPVLSSVLYRQRVSKDPTRIPDGPMVQVSPLVDSIAWQVDELNRNYFGYLQDPFIALGISAANPPNASNPSVFDFYLIDTHPAVIGTRYRYYLVRFQTPGQAAVGEIDYVVDCGEVEVP